MAEAMYEQPEPPKVDDKNLLSTDWLEGVIETPESDLRAHKVALTYSKLSGFLDDLINGSSSVNARVKRQKKPPYPCNANWFHFATWGTVTITRNIANDRPPQRIDTLPLSSLRRWLTPAVVQLRASSGQRVSRALSWGQRLIFVSVCFTLEDLDHWMVGNADDDPRSFDLSGDTKERILELGRWDGEPWIGETRHVAVVVQAFRFYIHAFQARGDPSAKARCMLGGNVLLTAVEQDLADKAVEAVVNHIPRSVASAVDDRLARLAERWAGVPSQVTRLQLPFRYTGARDVLDAAWSRLMTDQVFVMALPTETLRLGRDIPPRHPGQPYFPQHLQSLGPTTVASPPTVEPAPDVVERSPAADNVRQRLEKQGGEGLTNPEGERHEKLERLQDALHNVELLVASLDRTSGGGKASAARDWRRWDERMNWAVTLLRSRQQDETLYWSPYSKEDQIAIVNDRLPRRSGDPSALEIQPPIGTIPQDESEGNEV
jgi:hypothetical protein